MSLPDKPSNSESISSIDELLAGEGASNSMKSSKGGLDENSSDVAESAQGIGDLKSRGPERFVKAPVGSKERRHLEDRRKKQKLIADSKEKFETKQAEIKLQQHRRKILLAGCEPVMGLNFNSLAMDDYPDNALVAAARRDRDYWVLICSLFSLLFIFSVLGVVSPWLGGVGCGLAFLSAIFAFSPVRKYFFERPHLHELLNDRKRIEYTALHHVQYLEGQDGLAWRCEKLAKFNSNLEKNVFKGLYRYSKAKDILSYLVNKKTIRLYLLLMIESQKAYKRLEKDYLESHFKNIEAGLDDRIDEGEARKLEQMLNDVNSAEE